MCPPSVAEGDSFPRWGTPSHQLKLSPLGESGTASAVTKGVAGFECVRDFLPLFSLVDLRENASGGILFSSVREKYGKENAQGKGFRFPAPLEPPPNGQRGARAAAPLETQGHRVRRWFENEGCYGDWCKRMRGNMGEVGDCAPPQSPKATASPGGGRLRTN